MNLILTALLSFYCFAESKSESFVIQIADRNLKVVAADKRRDIFAVLIENRSLSDQIGKFIVNGKKLKFVSVRSGSSETVEIENKTSSSVIFVPVSPAFQEVELIFGKKSYEIPVKE
jgi:hypothetical protein